MTTLPRHRLEPLHAIFDACQGCGACLLTCHARAIRPHAGTSPVPGRLAVTARLVAGPACDGCGDCVEICPVDAVRLAPTTPTTGAHR